MEEQETAQVLCLHGWRSNNDVTERHARHLRLQRKFAGGIVCLHGNVAAPGAADEATDAFFQGPFFSWVEKDLDQAARGAQLIDALKGVVRHVERHGVYDCVFGFSQGGAIVTLLSIPAVLQRLGARSMLWRSAIVACGASCELLQLAEENLGVSITHSAATIPSLHIIGADDVHKTSSERLLQVFAPFGIAVRVNGGHANPQPSSILIRHAVYFAGAHGIPSALATDADFKAEFDAWLAARHEAQQTIVWAAKPSSGGRQGTLALTRSLTRSRGRSRIVRQLSSLPRTPSLRSEDAAERGALLPQAKPTVLGTLHELSSTPITTTAAGGGLLRFDLQGRAIVICEASKRSSSRTTIPQLLQRAPPEAPFLRSVDPRTKALTYGELLHFMRPGGLGDLRRSGLVHEGQVVVYVPPPGPAGAVALLAISAQCTAAPLDPGSTESEMVDALQQLKPAVALAFRGFTPPAIEAAASKLGLPIRWQVIDEAIAGIYSPENSTAFEGISPLAKPSASTALLLRTSGSTAKPKVVPLCAGSICANAIHVADSLGLTREDVALNAMPLFHIGGISASILATAAAQASVVCMPNFEPVSFVNTLVHGSKPLPTWYTAVPTMHLAALAYAKDAFESKAPSHALRFIRTGAAPLSHVDAMKLSEFWGVKVVTSYSMTEQMPISSKPLALDTAVCQDTVGQPLCCSIALIDGAALRPVSWGQQGELCISGANVMEKYVDTPQANASAFFWIGSQRFFRTGDIARKAMTILIMAPACRLDDNAFIYLVGRCKEMIKVGGEQISPLEIEAVIHQHPDVKTAVVFGVPSPTWGEEVGIAIVLRRSTAKLQNEEAISTIRNYCRSKLGAQKVPAHWRIVEEEDLPKTAAGKYIRIGAAERLGISVKAFSADVAAEKRPPARVSIGLNGMRYIMALGVMFNHIGAVWQGADERNPMTFGPSFISAKATTFYFPATVFFVLGGYTLSAALATKPIKTGTWLSFYNSRFQALMPMYLLAVLIALINLLIVCQPTNYSPQFSWQPFLETRLMPGGDMSSCQSGPVEMPYGAWLFSTLAIFAFGLQAWFFAFFLIGWLLYYAWFNSVYYFAVLLFPFMQNALAKRRGNVRAIMMWFGIYCIGIFLTCGALAAYYLFPRWQHASTVDEAKSWQFNQQNIYALSSVLFPPYWVPCVGAGMAAYFWYDAVRPAQSHSWWWYGVACDLLSATFLAFHIAMLVDYDWPYPISFVGKMWKVFPEEAHRWDTGIDRYVWSVLVVRLYAPLIAVWIALASMPGKSMTARLLEWRPLAVTLGPTSYGCFLFHQIVDQWYWWATRTFARTAGEVSMIGVNVAAEPMPPPTPGSIRNSSNLETGYSWWSYPKGYYWFSPQPMPVAWYEFFYLAALTTLFTMFCNAYLNAPLTLLWISGTRALGRLFGMSPVKQQLPAEYIVRQALAELTGDAAAAGEPDSDFHNVEFSLEHLGLASVGLPMLVGLMNSKDGRIGLKVSDIVEVNTLGDLIALIASRQQNADQDTGIGTAPL